MQVVSQQQPQRFGPAGGLLLLRHLRAHLLVCGGVLQVHPDVAADEPQRPCQKEGNSPPPGVHGIVTEDREHTGHHERAGKEATGSRSRNQRRVDTAPSRRCVLGKEGSGTRVLAGGGESLNHSQDKEAHGACHADSRVRGKETDEECRSGHDKNRPGQCPTASPTVSPRPPYNGADRAQNEGHREYCICREQLD